MTSGWVHGVCRVACLTLLFCAFSTVGGSASANRPQAVTFHDRIVPAGELEKALEVHGEVSLRDVTVVGPVHLPDGEYRLASEWSRFDSQVDAGVGHEESELDLKHTVFAAPFNLSRSRFRSVQLRDDVFESDVNFSSSAFGNLELNASSFRGKANFSYATIGELAGCLCLNLFSTDFNGFVDMTNLKAADINTAQLHASAPIDIDWVLLRTKAMDSFNDWVLAGSVGSLGDLLNRDRPQNIWAPATAEAQRRQAIYESQLRFWRSNYETLGRPREALQVNALLIQSRRSNVLRPSQLEWWVISVLGVFTGFGTHPYRLLAIAALAILLFSAPYTRARAFSPALSQSWAKRIPGALAFSANAFVPFAKFIDDDWGHTITTHYRWLPILERITGIMVVALAAYSIKSFTL